jgi:hypothetical protein
VEIVLIGSALLVGGLVGARLAIARASSKTTPMLAALRDIAHNSTDGRARALAVATIAELGYSEVLRVGPDHA